MTPEQTDEPTEADRQAGVMKDQLLKDVASWSAARSGDHAETAARAVPPPVKPAATRAPRQKAKPPEPVPPVPAEKKPFRMSYDGTTDRDYIAQRIKLGAR